MNTRTLYRIKVRTEQKNESVTLLSDGRLLVCVRAKREEGRANERLVVLVAGFLDVPEDAITIMRGHTLASKTLSVLPK